VILPERPRKRAEKLVFGLGGDDVYSSRVPEKSAV
jgi:hypothetical protein